MRVLLSGGTKTQNIVNAISKKFQASGDEFIIVEFLDNIGEIYGRGDYFDKAIITEQSITREYSIVDEYEIRERINNFAKECKSRSRKLSYVFLTQEENMAKMIYDEILPIMSCSVVVYSKPPYVVPFFVKLIVDDVKQLPSDITYIPPDIVTKIEEENAQKVEDGEGIEIEDPNMVLQLAPPDEMNPFTQDPLGLGNDIFVSDIGENTGFGFNGESNDNFGFNNPDGIWSDGEKSGEEFEFSGNDNSGNNGFEFSNGNENINYTNNNFDTGGDLGNSTFGINNGNGFENTGNGEYIDSSNSSANDIFNEGTDFVEDNGWGNGGDEVLNMEQEYSGPRSGDLPDYTVQIQQEQMSEDTIAPMVVNDTENKIEGFDEEGFDAEYYGNEKQYEPSNFTPSNQVEDDGEFGSSMYSPKQAQVQNQSMDQYQGDLMVAEIEESQMGQELYSSNENWGTQEQEMEYTMPEQEFSPSTPTMDYEQTAQYTNQQVQNQQRKGIKSFIGGKRQAQTVNQQTHATSGINIARVKDTLRPFASRGNSIVVSGCGGCGTSIVAFNLANIIAQIGYTVLLVDMDMETRTQNFISKASYDSMDVEGANLMAAVNSSTNANSNTTVVRTGFHLLTMGLAGDVIPIEEQLHKEKIARFSSVMKTSYNFIIYDIPFRHMTGFLHDITYNCENLVLVTDASNWGITKTMLAIGNIDSEDMQDMIISKAQILFNKYRNLNRLFGLKIKSCNDIVKAMHNKIIEIVGEDIGIHLDNMSIAGIINDDPLFENGWYEDVQYSDTKRGQEIFLELIENIVLKKY